MNSGLSRVTTGALVGALLLLTACPKDPYSPDTWIDKLDTPEWEKAVVELERLHDPVAIEPLGKAWKQYNKNPKILRSIIVLANQPAERGGPRWGPAVPYLIEALDGYDPANRRSVDDAVVAAEALGKSKDPTAVSALIRATALNREIKIGEKTTTQELPKLSPGQNVRIAAIAALGNFGSNPEAVDVLIKVLQTDNDKQPELVNAAAANALADSGSEKALQPLLIALYKIPRIYRQVRGALVKLRAQAAPELILIMKGQHKALEQFAKENNFANDCGTAEGPRSKCTAPGNLDFKAAALLGDMRAKEAVPALIAELNDPAQIAFFNPRTGEPGPTDHSAILDALRKLGDPSAASAVLAYAKNDKTDDTVRPMAIDVFSFLARGTEGMDWLAAQVKNEEQEEEIRKSAALAYARLVYGQAQMEPIQWLIDRYKNKAAELDKQAGKDPARAREAGGYRDLAALFDQDRARAVPGIKCKQDAACYQKILTSKPTEILDLLAIPKAEQDKLDRNLRDGYRIAVFERCLMELAKLGPGAAVAQPQLLELAGSRDRIIRQGALLALPAVASKPCPPCVTALEKVIESQSDSDTLSELNAETELVWEYFKAK